MPQGAKNIYHLLLAFFATIFFRYPGKSLTVIGVTGTDGKTTTVHLIYEILKSAGKKVSMISSVGAKIGNKDYELPFHVTTPSSWQLQKFLRLAVDRGEEFMVLEVTSHGLDQNRVFGCHFKVGVITNITHEHLDYHKTYKNYMMAKAKLFQGIEWAILNREDESYEFLNAKCRMGNAKIISYGLKEGDITPANFPFRTPLPGEYNRQNVLAAIATAKALAISDSKIRQTVVSFSGVLGRFEFVKTGREFKTIIDFAHTPNALEKVLSTVKPQVSGRLIHVFGSAGLRDRLKRPKMGEVSAKYADVIILTEEDYRTENVDQIIDEIASGAVEIGSWRDTIKPKANSHYSRKTGLEIGKNLFKIPDRQKAINFAFKVAKKGDLVILTGKGHERSLCRGKKEYPWSEREAIKKALSTL